MNRFGPLRLLILLLAAVALPAIPSRGGQSPPGNPAFPAQPSWPRTPTRLSRPAVPEDFAVAHHAQAQQGAGGGAVLFIRDVSALSGDVDGGNEPSVAIDPNNPNRIAILGFAGGWGADAPLWFSTDGGLTWTQEFTIGFPPGDPNGGPNDQTPDFGSDGNLYGTFLSGPGIVFSGSTANPASATAWQYFLVAGNAQRTDFNGTFNKSDQPWLIVNRDPTTAAQVNTYVAYDDFGTAMTHVSVARGTSPPNFVADNAVSTFGGIGGNPGTRLANDPTTGAMYALWERAGAAPPNRDYVLFHSTDAGATWTNAIQGGGPAATAQSDQPGPAPTLKFGTVNALLGGVQHAAVDPNTGDVYYVFGNKDGAGNNRLSILRLQDTGSGKLVQLVPSTFVGVTGSGPMQAALPSVAVASNGTVGVLYVTFDGFSSTVDPTNPPNHFPIFTDHFAVSDDHGATWTDQVLLTFLSTATFDGTNGDKQRVLGDFHQVKAVGRFFYGTFAGNGITLGQSTASIDAIFFKAFAGGPQVQINPSFQQFETVCPGQSLQKQFSVFNTGTTDLHVLSITPLPGADPSFILSGSPTRPTTISPDAHVDYTVLFFPIGAPGPKNATFQITTDDPDNPVVQVSAFGTVGAPILTVQGCPVDFGTVGIGDAAGHEKEIQICNTGSCDLHITSVSFVPPTTEFKLVETSPTPGTPLTISPDSCISFHIKFTPTSSGTKNATLVITNSDGIAPFNCAVTGTTQTASAADLDAPAGIAFPPTVIQAFGPCFSDVAPAISNKGAGLLRINSVTLGGANPGDYALIGLPSSPIFLNAGDVLGDGGFFVRFQPTVVSRARTATLQIVVGDPVSGANIGEVDVPLSGEGVRPGARLLVTQGGVPVPKVPAIQLFKLEHETDTGGDFNVIATYKNVPAKNVVPAPPGTPFTFHVENGGLGSPKKIDRLRPGATYRYSATVKVGKKFVTKIVTFNIENQHTFLNTLTIDF